MLSLGIQSALEQEVVGQHRAVLTIVRTLTVAMSGLADPARPIGVYLLMGPSGTGKTHMGRSLARVLHGDAQQALRLDCHQIASTDPWQDLGRQIAPCFGRSRAADDAPPALPPRSVLLVEHLEAAGPELVRALVSALEAGSLILPDGKRGSLGGCLVLLTTRLCAREIYGDDRQEIGFSSAIEDLEEREKARIYQVCSSAAEKKWGAELLGHVDDLIVFHRLREGHLPLVLRRLLIELNRRLAAHDIAVELDPGTLSLLIERSRSFCQHGAWFLVKVFHRFVTFPVADLLSSGGLWDGGRVHVERVDQRLRFTVSGDPRAPERHGASGRRVEIAVDWSEPPAGLLTLAVDPLASPDLPR